MTKTKWDIEREKRRWFETGDEEIEIYMNPNGSLTIEATSSYGDTQNGWGETHAHLTLTPAKVAELRKFLGGES